MTCSITNVSSRNCTCQALFHLCNIIFRASPPRPASFRCVRPPPEQDRRPTRRPKTCAIRDLFCALFIDIAQKVRKSAQFFSKTAQRSKEIAQKSGKTAQVSPKTRAFCRDLAQKGGIFAYFFAKLRAFSAGSAQHLPAFDQHIRPTDQQLPLFDSRFTLVNT